MAEPRDGSGIDWLGQDLLSAALGESGLNLDEAARTDFSEPVSLPAIGNNQYNFHGTNILQPEQGNLAANESNLDNNFGTNLDLNFDELNDIFDEVNRYLYPHISSVTRCGSNDVPFSTAKETSDKTQNLDFLSVESVLGDSIFPAQSSSSTLPDFSTTSLASTARALLELASGSNNSNQEPINQEPINAISKKDLSRLWSNDDVSLNHVSEKIQDEKKKPLEEEEEEEEEEEFGHTDTYAEYVPSKLKLGRRHPDPVIETSSLSSVQPPDIWYRLSLPEEVIQSGWLSALQLEAVVYACQQHEQLLADGSRAGFLIGDGAGVGKGRTVAGIIYENYLCGRKRAIWLSVSNDLKFDAERDLRDIGCRVHVYPLNKFKYEAKLSSKTNGSVKKGVIFATYSSLIGESQGSGKYCTRLNQLLHWCGSSFEGVIILDECHKAKNLVPTGSSKPTKTGLTVLLLQQKLPKARVVYCSATGASEPKNMAYMSRLGIWGPGTPFKEFNDFIQAVERRGVGAMEIVAMDMKLRGMYMARQLSFAGVSFDVKDVKLSQQFIEMYDEAVRLWNEAREKFEKAVNLMEADNRMKKTMWGQFWSAHQRFFKYLCIASKVDHAVHIAKESLAVGKCVVIGLQSTGEARTLEQLEECGGQLNDFVSTAKGVLGTLIEKHFPAPDKKKITDLFGFEVDSDASDMRSDNSSPVPQPAKKRKKVVKRPAVKKAKSEVQRLFNMDSSSSSDDEDEKTARDRNGVDKSDSDTSDNNEEEDEDEDDSNPFKGSDSDDPWLTRKVKKNKVKSEDSGYNSALAAAGLSVGELPWTTNRRTSKLSNGLNMARNTSFSKLRSVSVASSSPNRNLQPSASSPVLMTLLSNVGSTNTTGLTPSEQCWAMKRSLLEKVADLGPRLPPNTLDQLIDQLGGPQCVSEMTGRKGRVVSKVDGSVGYESRSKEDVPLEVLNIAEKRRFMDGEKKVAIISEAASSGISLQADRRVKNQTRRVHITLELPWSADKAIQQFGRTHRSNQVSAPEYLFLISELAGEHRFASIVAKRLESLGALTHGDRRATESRDLSRYNVDNKYGRTALESTLKCVVGIAQPLIPPPSDYLGDFFHDVRTALVGVGLIQKFDNGTFNMPDKDYTNMSRFLNRILGIEVELQNQLFGYFMDTLAAVVHQAKNSGRWDDGILDLGSHGEDVSEQSVQTFVESATSGVATTQLHTVSVERGMTWEQAQQLAANSKNPDDGFYLQNQSRNSKKMAIFVQTTTRGKKKKACTVYRPHTGCNLKQELIDDLKKRYRKVSEVEVEAAWKHQFEASLEQCTHAYWKGNCKKVSLGLTCEVGLRKRTFYILSGSVLGVWSKIESVLAGQSGANSKIQIIRCRISNGKKIVGCLIPKNCIPALTRILSPNPSDVGASSSVICVD